jgi:hypothetical protein
MVFIWALCYKILSVELTFLLFSIEPYGQMSMQINLIMNLPYAVFVRYAIFRVMLSKQSIKKVFHTLFPTPKNVRL